MENIKEIYFSQVAGYESYIDELIKIRSWILDDTIERNKLPKGILFQGQSGYGKTLIANCFINSLKCKCFSLTCNDHDIYKTLSNMIEEMKKEKICVLFIDEIDLLLDKDSKLVGLLQQVMDGYLFENTYVMTILITNSSRSLPKPLIRRGRIDRRFEFGILSQKENEEILSFYLDKYNFSSSDIRYLSKLNIKPSDVKVIRDDCLLRGGNNFSLKDFLFSYDIIIMHKYKGNALNIDKNVKYLISIHEAGHIIMLLKYSNYFSFFKAYIQDNGGKTLKIDANDYCLHSLNYKYADVCANLGGYYAEELIFKARSVGCYLDLAETRYEIKMMIKSSGYFSPIDVESSVPVDIEHCVMSKKEQDRLYSRELKIYKKAIKETKQTLKRNKENILKIADIMMKNGEVVVDDLKDIVIK